tara:strand:- start:5523 stop:7190 length:1668 start_codon:yes stop_codon:yes gene_type:complete
MAIPTYPLGGFTTGQLIGELVQDQQGQDSKTKRRRNLAMGVGLLIGGGDATLKADNNQVIDKLNKSQVTDIAKSSKMYDDALKLQTVQESIDSYGGGLNGALVHYDPQAELAFNVKHKNQLKYFDDSSATSSAIQVKQDWKNNFIKDNLYKQHQLKYTGADAKRISELSRKEYNAPVEEYFAAQINQANDPANKSTVHKGFRKGAEFLGFRTKGDELSDKVLEEQIDYNIRNKKIDKYRNIYASPKIVVPTKLTKNTIEGLAMTRNEFFEAWNNDSKLSDDYAEYAFQEFTKNGGRLIDYQNVAVGYLGDKAYNDTIPLKEKAIARAKANPQWKDMSEPERLMSENIAVVEAMGGNASSLKVHLETRRAVSELIDTGKYKLPKDDPTTPKIDERKEAEDLIYANTWAKVKKETVRKLTGEIDLDKVRQDYVTAASTLLYTDIRKKNPETMNAILTTQLPTGITEESKQFGVIYLENLLQDKYKNNQTLLKNIQLNLVESNYNLQTMQVQDRKGYEELLEAQQRYFIYKQHEDFNAGSYIATRQLEASQDPLNFPD